VTAAAAGGVRLLIEQYRQLVAGPLRVLVTGGDAPYLLPHLDPAAQDVPDLILRGLLALAARPSFEPCS
jgi:pantothenate kinase type III